MNTLLLPLRFPLLRPTRVATALKAVTMAMAAGLLDTARRATRQALGLRADGWVLLREATGGDPTSARALVRELTPAALALARQMLGRTEDAEDAVQDSFLRLWNARPDDQRGAQLSAYFNTIVLNRCRSQLVRQRELAVEPETLTALHDRNQQNAEPEPDAPLDATHLHAAMATLPARQRMALAMWAYADADVSAIATALSIDANAAHQLLHRAKRGLRGVAQRRLVHPARPGARRAAATRRVVADGAGRVMSAIRPAVEHCHTGPASASACACAWRRRRARWSKPRPSQVYRGDVLLRVGVQG